MQRALMVIVGAFSMCVSAAVTFAEGPVPVEQAAEKMTLPDGFRATLFAGEPDVVQPIAMTFDDRGRLWVVECLSYPKWETEGQPGKDRVLIFEDTNGDGKFDERKVFWDQGANLTGIEYGFGGIWLTATPNFIFVPDANKDDVPDGPPVIKLDGWDLKAKHNVFNGLTWGPDGWLYGCNGILSNSKVGKPGAKDDERVAIDCGVWRYHPTREKFEWIASGTTNPWGLDFDDEGEMFITNCVIKHLFHVVPGGHYQRMFGQDLNPHVYGLMESCADHIHWGGGSWTDSRGGKGVHDKPGGGHAHVGAMVYLGENWPEKYRGGLFTCNVHGNRVNHDVLEKHGSGFVAKHADDFLYANDEWFRGIAIKQGPDGGVFVSDWSDTGECHDYEDIHRENGRIYKVVYGTPKPFHEDLAKRSDADLLELLTSRNEWVGRHARRLLQERSVAGTLEENAGRTLKNRAWSERKPREQLRYLWAARATGQLGEAEVREILESSQDVVRCWGVRTAVEEGLFSDIVKLRLAEMALSDKSPRVRLTLASALQRLPVTERMPIAERLMQHEEDARDDNLPWMVWYGVEPIVAQESHAKQGSPLLMRGRIPLVRQLIARREAGIDPARVVNVLEISQNPAVQRDALRGLSDVLEGRRAVKPPANWSKVAERLYGAGSEEIEELTTAIALVFGDAKAFQRLRKQAADAKETAERRRHAVQALVQAVDPELPGILVRLLGDNALRATAIRGLAAFNEPRTATLLLDGFAKFNETERAAAIGTLASRKSWTLAMLDAMEKGRIAPKEMSAFTARQLVQLKDKEITARLEKVWGAVRPANQDKAARLAKLKEHLTPDLMKTADSKRGREIFTKSCATCHVLFGEGAKLGPDLTGAQRSNLEYFLENLVDPSALVGRDYQTTVIETKAGRIITGIVTAESGETVTLRSPDGTTVVLKSDIEERRQLPVSLMPEGLPEQMTPQQLRDLSAYLGGDGK